MLRKSALALMAAAALSVSAPGAWAPAVVAVAATAVVVAVAGRQGVRWRRLRPWWICGGFGQEASVTPAAILPPSAVRDFMMAIPFTAISVVAASPATVSFSAIPSGTTAIITTAATRRLLSRGLDALGLDAGMGLQLTRFCN